MRCRHPVSIAFLFVLCLFVLTSTASPYDGPVGVTFRAPFIHKGAGVTAVTLEGLSIREKIRIDDSWSLEIDGKGRAFPDQFKATIADSEIMFELVNEGRQKVTTSIILPFDSSDTENTGFTKPLSITAFINGRATNMFKGPELPRGMMKVRSYRIPVIIPAASTVALKVTTSHRLAMNPAWYQFICTDTRARFPNYQSLTKNGCDLEFELDPVDERLMGKPLEFQLKKASQKISVAEQKYRKISFRDESIEWVRVFR